MLVLSTLPGQPDKAVAPWTPGAWDREDCRPRHDCTGHGNHHSNRHCRGRHCRAVTVGPSRSVLTGRRTLTLHLIACVTGMIRGVVQRKAQPSACVAQRRGSVATGGTAGHPPSAHRRSVQASGERLVLLLKGTLPPHPGPELGRALGRPRAGTWCGPPEAARRRSEMEPNTAAAQEKTHTDSGSFL